MYTKLSVALIAIVVSCYTYAIDCDGKKISCGYPTYDQSGNNTSISPGMVFKKANGFPIHAKIGAKDFFLQGKISNINKYLKERREFNVIAQTLEDNGKWKDKGSRSVQVVITNQGKDAYILISEYVRDKIIDALTDGGMTQLISNKLADIASKIGVSITKDELEKIVTKIENKSKSDSVSYLVNYFSKLKSSNSTGGAMISKKESLIITLTAYPAPKTNARAVCDLKKSTVSVKDIEKTINSFLNGQGC